LFPFESIFKNRDIPAGQRCGNQLGPFKEKVAGTTDINQYLLKERLRSQGYCTGRARKLHFVPAEEDFGFDFKALNDAPYSTPISHIWHLHHIFLYRVFLIFI